LRLHLDFCSEHVKEQWFKKKEVLLSKKKGNLSFINSDIEQNRPTLKIITNATSISSKTKTTTIWPTAITLPNLPIQTLKVTSSLSFYIYIAKGGHLSLSLSLSLSIYIIYIYTRLCPAPTLIPRYFCPCLGLQGILDCQMESSITKCYQVSSRLIHPLIFCSNPSWATATHFSKCCW
jgi:hypothetical protein